MCPNGGSLHDTQTIKKLFEDIIDIVLKKNTNDEIKHLGQALERLRESVVIALDRLKKRR